MTAYVLLTESHQFPGRKVGDTIEMPARAAKYLLHADVLGLPEPIVTAGEAEIDGVFTPAAGVQLGPAEVPPAKRAGKPKAED